MRRHWSGLPTGPVPSHLVRARSTRSHTRTKARDTRMKPGKLYLRPTLVCFDIAWEAIDDLARHRPWLYPQCEAVAAEALRKAGWCPQRYAARIRAAANVHRQ